jgi:hemoglobin
MKKDISEREDILALLEAFYARAVKDEAIGHFFTTVAPLNLQTHIPLIADFWESVLFGTRGYAKNVMQVHQHLHLLSPILPEHLDRWVALFSQTVDQHFEGSRAELARQRALSIAQLMKWKLGGSQMPLSPNKPSHS